MTAKGLTWTAAHLRAAGSAEEVRTAIAEARTQLGEGAVPASTVLVALEELALEAARARGELRSANRLREVLLASVAHDLRNPLNTFAMSVGLLRDDLEGPDFDRTRALSLLSRMDRASQRMQAMIDDLLEASRVEAGSIEIVRRPEQATVILQAAAAKSRPLVAEKGVRLEEGLVSEATLEADRARTAEALTKLVAVALKSTAEGGVIRLGSERDGDDILFTIRPTGPRGTGTPLPDESRSGIALVIARGLVAAQGGQVTSELTPEGPRTVVRFAARA